MKTTWQGNRPPRALWGTSGCQVRPKCPDLAASPSSDRPPEPSPLPGCFHQGKQSTASSPDPYLQGKQSTGSSPAMCLTGQREAFHLVRSFRPRSTMAGMWVQWQEERVGGARRWIWQEERISGARGWHWQEERISGARRWIW